MQYRLVAVPPGGGKMDHTAIIADATLVPRAGDYIVVPAPDEPGVRAYLVRCVTIAAAHNADGLYRQEDILVEAELIRHPYQSRQHRQSLAAYEASGLPVRAYPPF